ncbi:MAG: hypothetical protein MJZ89_01280 [Paludibacteraceae bacterium]|nr:hypothetical protein [Paludibacteraceae bacterium]
MRILDDISELSVDQWQQLLSVSSTASWFQTPEAYAFYLSLPDIFEPFVIAIDAADGQSLRAVCVGYITVECSRLKRYFTRRAIIYSGPLLANDATHEEVQTLLTAVQQHIARRAIYIETRNFCDYHHWREAFELAGYHYHPHYDMFITCDSKEAMFARMQEGKCRQIGHALQEGAILTETTDQADIKAYYDLLEHLYRTKVKTPLYPLSFFLTFVRNGVGKLLIVKQKGVVIGGMLCPIFRHPNDSQRCVIYEWFVVGDVICTWAAMDYAVEHSIPLLDLMGAGEPGVPYGVRDFKQAMGGQIAELGRYRYVSHPVLFEIGKIGVRLLKK